MPSTSVEQKWETDKAASSNNERPSKTTTLQMNQRSTTHILQNKKFEKHKENESANYNRQCGNNVKDQSEA